MRALIVAFTLALAPLTAQAEDALNPPHPALAPIQAELNRCKEAKPGNIPEMLCTIDADKAVDAVLNALYGEIVAKLKQAGGPDQDVEDRKELLKRLIASERAWIAYREAECSHAAAEMLGGSGEKTLLAECSLSMRLDRVNSLFGLYRQRFPEIAK
ncbi:DUF1311 domain-containing protein [Bradyrhizobium tropiciagri]|uniref:lysozyme inhibitor LprI family protein n=1 Tax=Bradyrhizobium tropiciagri TaxID=312253 RepID=UPI001BAD7520|nr:lysozyme inhibitor LprI family protein [Bradyrhizobium tropiciagri]MBR0896283.1 DUF1311 domain-containing protein [Bradyrhizobium tropiciagri]